MYTTMAQPNQRKINMVDMFYKVMVNSIASYNFRHKHKSENKNTPSVPYYVFNKGKLDFDWTDLYRLQLLLPFTWRSCKGKKKKKMFKKETIMLIIFTHFFIQLIHRFYLTNSSSSVRNGSSSISP